ncbi:hypothetical protein M0Q50_07870 [bacterium]|jgi:hypothetical protein|nr:hypothetical protein [bacterium]
MINVDIAKRFITDSSDKYDLSNLEYLEYNPHPNNGDTIINCLFFRKNQKDKGIITFSFFLKYYKIFEKKYNRIEKLKSI